MPEAERVTAALAIASGIALPDNPLERLTPGSVADEIALAWPAFVSGLAALIPAIVVIEDLHWAEEPLLEMLERMIARSTGPLLLIATARPELAERRSGVERSARDLADLARAPHRRRIARARRRAAPAIRWESPRTDRGDRGGQPVLRRRARTSSGRAWRSRRSPEHGAGRTRRPRRPPARCREARASGRRGRRPGLLGKHAPRPQSNRAADYPRRCAPWKTGSSS